jgi:hypothetical protein
VIGNFWLKKWSEINEIEGRNPEIGKYIGVYFAFGMGASALVILQTLILWIFCSIEVCPVRGYLLLTTLTDRIIRHLENCMSGWPLQFSDHL